MRTKWALSIVILIGVLPGFAGGQEKAKAHPLDQSLDATANMSGSKPVGPPDSHFQQRDPRYKLEAGDSFEVFFELSPEFNQTATVQPDGYITLRGIGDLQVANCTMPELTQVLRSAYSEILHEPRITVVLKDFEKAYFIADGQVGRPGKYDMRGDTTLTQAIAMSGGFLDSAKHSQVLLFRRASEGWFSAQIFDVKKMEKEGNLLEDPYLHPGDMLFVPKNRFSKIKPFLPGYSVGAMVQPH
jgi:polysaccharide export outer membrane protein